MAKGGRHGLLRARGGPDDGRVEFVELFFDLVFVFAITQLSHRLIEHPSTVGALETLILFLAVWWAWINTAWVTNWLDPHRTRVRLLLFGMMAAGLFVSMSIPEAFGNRGAAFALAYVTMLLSSSLFAAFAFRRPDPANHRNFVRIAIWIAIAGLFWIAGGFSAPEHRLPLWAAAAAIWSVAPTFGFYVPGLGRSTTADWRVDAHHLAERCGLFIIIALGESILVTGVTFTDLAWTSPALAAFAGALLSTVAMWWIYFNVGAERASRIFAASDDPGRVARLAYTYVHVPIVAGIVIAAAADEWVLAHPTDHAEVHVAVAAIGGPALFLAGTALFKRLTGAQYWPLSHIIGLQLLLLLFLAWQRMEPYQLSLAVAVLLSVVAMWETISLQALARWREAEEGT